MAVATLVVALFATAGCGRTSGMPTSQQAAGDDDCPATSSGTAHVDWVPFVRHEGRMYVEETVPVDGPGLEADRLGERLGEVRCRIGDVVHDPAYQPQDGDAAYLDPGTPLHAVEGFDPAFRLAADDGRTPTLFEADDPPDAATGRDLLGDLEGRVVAINVRSSVDGTTLVGTIDDPEVVDELFGTVLDAPYDPDAPGGAGGERYLVEFTLEDLPPVDRMLSTDGQVLGRGIQVDEAFVDAVRAAG